MNLTDEIPPLAAGAGIQKLAKRHGVGVGTVQRIKTDMMARPSI